MVTAIPSITCNCVLTNCTSAAATRAGNRMAQTRNVYCCKVDFVGERKSEWSVIDIHVPTFAAPTAFGTGADCSTATAASAWSATAFATEIQV
ncbi:hypothetical protein AJ88_39015 [Mesorhizobium amorphae CCBAU 01583]|nr:hypothetical protein AJ88_39015 [Mesorhizobium amorphae CCBAU 01583]